METLVLEYGDKTEIGRRPTNEDTHLCVPDFKDYVVASKGSCENASLFAIFDGHGGSRVSNILESDFLTTLVKCRLECDSTSTEELMKTTFIVQDELLKEVALQWKEGATAAVILLEENVLTVANVGDTEVLLVYAGDEGDDFLNCDVLTKIHHPEGEEKKRIEDLGGKVFFNRVNGMLAVSRSFADFQYKKPKTEDDFVSVVPHIRSVRLDSRHKFIILACDGLWEAIKYGEAVKIVQKCQMGGCSAEQTACALAKAALVAGSQDNITIIVVFLEWGATPQLTQKSVFSTTANESCVIPNVDFVEKTHADDFIQCQSVLTFSNKSATRGGGFSVSSFTLVDEAPVVLKSVIGETLKRSYFYMTKDMAPFCITKLGFLPDLPCWVSQELVSGKLYGEEGLRHLRLCEQFQGRFFLWAAGFSNVHTTFHYEEKPIFVDGVKYAGAEHTHDHADQSLFSGSFVSIARRLGRGKRKCHGNCFDRKVF